MHVWLGGPCGQTDVRLMRTQERSSDVDTLCTLPPRRRSRGDASRADGVEQRDAIEVVATRLAVGLDAVRASTVLLSDAERQRATRFAFARDRRRFIVARARLRQLLARRLGVRPEAVELVYGARGKPALAPRFADLGVSFNVSHCGEVAVYALAYGRAVGIDVEAVRVLPDGDQLAARFFAPRERAVYRALPARDKPVGFFNCWTRKEAVIKALGDGLAYPLDRFEVSLAPGEPARILRIENRRGEDTGWSLASFRPAPGYVGAIASRPLDRGPRGFAPP